MEPSINLVELLQKIKLMQRQIDAVQLLTQEHERVLQKIDEKLVELNLALERLEFVEEESLTDEDWEEASKIIKKQKIN